MMLRIRLLVNHDNLYTPVVIVVLKTILMRSIIVTLSAIWDIAISASTFSFDTVI
jgi:hypothetical protein